MTDAVRLEALAPGGLGDFADVLGGPEFGGCFCAVWTAHGPDWEARCADPARPNLAVTRRRVEDGAHTGFLVRDGGALVAWTGAGPKTAFPMLATKLGSRLTPSTADVWAIGCIAVREGHRGCGVPDRIVEAVVALAAEAGASAVEAYPTRPWDEPRSYRGSERLYARHGFEVAGSEPAGDCEILLMRRAVPRGGTGAAPSG